MNKEKKRTNLSSIKYHKDCWPFTRNMESICNKAIQPKHDKTIGAHRHYVKENSQGNVA